jgi:hypothetical protein
MPERAFGRYRGRPLARSHPVAAPEPSTAGVAEIKRLFSGRRRSRRFACERTVVVVGVRGSYPGRLLNVSRLGALVEIAHDDFLPADCEGSLIEIAGLLKDRFPNGITIRIPGDSVRLMATVVRVSPHASEPSSVFGCYFSMPLTRRQCRVLGVSADAAGDDPS